MKKGDALAGLLICVFALTGCPNKGSTDAAKSDNKAASSVTAPTDRSVRIASIDPDSDKPLRAGSSVKLAIAVEYTVPKPGGIVGVVIQDSNNASVKSNLREVPSGHGKVNSDIEFVVPNAKHIDVHVPLYVKGENKSSQVAVKKFLISPK
ncbi:MAG TPA: hypothetical protein VM937_10840 [Burkholderiaceae bacterium]|jgi:hypothetical protein|nr:hypothetical protein [Burkholderiaceae bacterium]